MESTTIKLELPKPNTETVRAMVKKYLNRDITPENAQETYEELMAHLHGSLAAYDALTHEADEQFPHADLEANNYQTGQKQVIDLIRRRHAALSNDFLLLATGR